MLKAILKNPDLDYPGKVKLKLTLDLVLSVLIILLSARAGQIHISVTFHSPLTSSAWIICSSSFVTNILQVGFQVYVFWWWDLGTVAIVGKVREIWGRSEGLISVLSSYSRLKSLHLLQFINDQKNAFCVFNNWNWNESSSVLYSCRHCRMQDMHTKGQGYSPSLPVTNQMTLVGLHLSEP